MFSKLDSEDKNLLTYLVGAVIVLWLATLLLLFLGSDSRGTFGDMFGATNALFSGLAFVGLIFALNMQRKELQLQRNELELQRKELQQNTAELSRSASAQEAAEKALTEQIIMMSRAAKINVLSSLLNSYSVQMSNPNFRAYGNSTKIEKEADKLRSQLAKVQADIPSF